MFFSPLSATEEGGTSLSFFYVRYAHFVDIHLKNAAVIVMSKSLGRGRGYPP
jgi:hypothetical protein